MEYPFPAAHRSRHPEGAKHAIVHLFGGRPLLPAEGFYRLDKGTRICMIGRMVKPSQRKLAGGSRGLLWALGCFLAVTLQAEQKYIITNSLESDILCWFTDSTETSIVAYVYVKAKSTANFTGPESPFVTVESQADYSGDSTALASGYEIIALTVWDDTPPSIEVNYSLDSTSAISVYRVTTIFASTLAAGAIASSTIFAVRFLWRLFQRLLGQSTWAE